MPPRLTSTNIANSRVLSALRFSLKVHSLLATQEKITETVTEMILAVIDWSPGRVMSPVCARRLNRPTSTTYAPSPTVQNWRNSTNHSRKVWPRRKRLASCVGGTRPV